MTITRTIRTTPFSAIAPAQVTRALIARARQIAAARGDTQIGFRVARDAAYHTMAYTDAMRGPAIGDSVEQRMSPIDDGDWIVRDGRWTLVRS